MEIAVALLALLVAAYALAAARLNRLSIGPALFFVVIGAVVSRILGVTDLSASADEAAQTLVEFTLVLILFTDASTLDWRRLRQDMNLTVRLLAIGLLLSIAFGTVLAAALFPELPLGVVLLIGAALAPTDAALGQPVITDRSVPVRIRRLLNAESGLNDGIATPFVVLALSLIASEFGGAADWLGDAVREGVVGLAVGCVIGGAGGWLLVRAERSGWTSSVSRQLAVVALAAGAYLLSLSLGGNGFIAAFVGGLAFGAASHQAEEGAEVFAEATGSALSIVVWLLAGAVFAGPILGLGVDARVIVLALLMLTVVRMIPVAISLLGSRLRPETVLFVGWFGPRGLASIVFGLLGVAALRDAGLASDVVAAVVAWTVILSVLLHGLSAGPLARRYAARIAVGPDGMLETEARPEPRRRIRRDWASDPSQSSDREIRPGRT